MSTLIGQGKTRIITSETDLEDYFQHYAKPAKCMRVGIEAEFFVVRASTGKALPYSGPGGIEAILAALAKKFSYEPVLEQKRIIALKRGGTYITLEPGGQMELSAEPVKTVFEIEKQIGQFVHELREISAKFPDTAWLAVGHHPFSKREEIEWVPKQRYAIMADFLGARGEFAHDMMKRTCTNQLNFDYLSEQHAMDSLRVALGVTTIVSAMFANSAFSEGKPNGYLCKRLEIWNHTDPARTGLLLQFLKPGRRFQDYLEYLLDMPLIFIVRGGKWIAMKDRTFRQFIHQGYEGQKATLGDFELQISTAFPEVRLKQYLEVRGVDCQSQDLIPAVAAFWKGLLYNAEMREEAWKLVADATDQERLDLHHSVPKLGLKAKLGKRSILEIARELVRLSCISLGKQKEAGTDKDECTFLNRIREKITVPGKSPAETLLEKWEGEFQKNPARLIEFLRIA